MPSRGYPIILQTPRCGIHNDGAVIGQVLQAVH